MVRDEARSGAPQERTWADGHRLLSPAQAAEACGVHPRTLARWAATGAITAVVTPGGHRRYRAEDIEALVSWQDERGGGRVRWAVARAVRMTRPETTEGPAGPPLP